MAVKVINLSSLDGTNGFRMDGAAKNDNLVGFSVSSAGDVNGDGFDDVIIAGAPYANYNGIDRTGSTYVVFGKDSGFDTPLNLSGLDGNSGFRLDGAAKDDYSGQSISSAGDVNGDGFDDLIIGAPEADPNGIDRAGSNYVVFGKGSDFDATMNLSSLNGTNGFRLDGKSAGNLLSMSVSNAGDVNGDGFDDVIVGAPFADSNGPFSGFTYVVFGKASGFNAALNLSSLDGINGFRLDGLAEDDSSGFSVSNAGDVNGDGFDDVIIGAPHTKQDGMGWAGSSYVVFGKNSGFSAALDLSDLNGTNGFRMDGVGIYDIFGTSVSSAGDVNGDGFDDVIIGAPSASPNGMWSGSSYVVFGKASNFDALLDLSSLNGSNGFRMDGVAEKDASGISVSNAGDINADGFDDLIVGAPYTDQNSTYVVFGKASGFNAVMNLSELDGFNGLRLDGTGSGRSVSGAGDVNGDCFDDLIIGAPGADLNGNYSGSSYVIFGRSDFNSGKVIKGTSEDDILVGGDEDDHLTGNHGNDKIDGGIGNDVLTGGLGNDILLAGFGEDRLSGNEGNDIFSFYATGYFTVQDFDKSSDLVTFNPETTGINDINDLLRVILSIEDNNEGVMVHFEEKIASINFIGLHSSDLTVSMVDFS